MYVASHSGKPQTRNAKPRAAHNRALNGDGVRAVLVLLVVAASLIVVAFRTDGAAHAASAPTTTIYPSSTVPGDVTENDDQAVELGVRFTTAQSGSILGVRFYKGPRNTGQHVGTLWSARGTKLASAVFDDESGTGWQTVRFSDPVDVSAGTAYVASYHTTTGYYSQQEWAFAGNQTLGNSAITADNGTYAYGDGDFPRSTWHDSAYFVDVLFAPGSDSGQPTPSPSKSTTSPPSPAPTTTTPAPPTTTTPAPPTTTTPAPPTPTTTTPAPPTPTTTAPTPTPTTSAPAPSGDNPPAAGTPSGTDLASMSGTTITTPNTVLDAKNINGGITIAASNVTIKNSRISGSDGTGIYVRSGSLTLSHTTISGFANGVGGDNYTASYVEVTGLQDDGFVLGSNVMIDSSWCHDFTPESGAHADCAQLQSGEVNVTVQNSWFDGTPSSPGGTGVNSALFLAPDLGPSSNGPLTIRNNVLGGGNFTLFCVDGNYGEYFENNITITGNRFLRDSQYGPVRVNVPVAWSGNIWADTLAPIGL